MNEKGGKKEGRERERTEGVGIWDGAWKGRCKKKKREGEEKERGKEGVEGASDGKGRPGKVKAAEGNGSGMGGNRLEM